MQPRSEGDAVVANPMKSAHTGATAPSQGSENHQLQVSNVAPSKSAKGGLGRAGRSLCHQSLMAIGTQDTSVDWATAKPSGRRPRTTCCGRCVKVFRHPFVLLSAALVVLALIIAVVVLAAAEQQLGAGTKVTVATAEVAMAEPKLAGGLGRMETSGRASVAFGAPGPIGVASVVLDGRLPVLVNGSSLLGEVHFGLTLSQSSNACGALRPDACVDSVATWMRYNAWFEAVASPGTHRQSSAWLKAVVDCSSEAAAAHALDSANDASTDPGPGMARVIADCAALVASGSQGAASLRSGDGTMRLDIAGTILGIPVELPTANQAVSASTSLRPPAMGPESTPTMPGPQGPEPKQPTVPAPGPGEQQDIGATRDNQDHHVILRSSPPGPAPSVLLYSSLFAALTGGPPVSEFSTSPGALGSVLASSSPRLLALAGTATGSEFALSFGHKTLQGETVPCSAGRTLEGQNASDGPRRCLTIRASVALATGAADTGRGQFGDGSAWAAVSHIAGIGYLLETGSESNVDAEAFSTASSALKTAWVEAADLASRRAASAIGGAISGAALAQAMAGPRGNDTTDATRPVVTLGQLLDIDHLCPALVVMPSLALAVYEGDDAVSSGALAHLGSPASVFLETLEAPWDAGTSACAAIGGAANQVSVTRRVDVSLGSAANQGTGGRRPLAQLRATIDLSVRNIRDVSITHYDLGDPGVLMPPASIAAVGVEVLGNGPPANRLLVRPRLSYDGPEALASVSVTDPNITGLATVSAALTLPRTLSCFPFTCLGLVDSRGVIQPRASCAGRMVTRPGATVLVAMQRLTDGSFLPVGNAAVVPDEPGPSNQTGVLLQVLLQQQDLLFAGAAGWNSDAGASPGEHAPSKWDLAPGQARIARTSRGALAPLVFFPNPTGCPLCKGNGHCDPLVIAQLGAMEVVQAYPSDSDPERSVAAASAGPGRGMALSEGASAAAAGLVEKAFASAAARGGSALVSRVAMAAASVLTSAAGLLDRIEPVLLLGGARLCPVAPSPAGNSAALGPVQYRVTTDPLAAPPIQCGSAEVRSKVSVVGVPTSRGVRHSNRGGQSLRLDATATIWGEGDDECLHAVARAVSLPVAVIARAAALQARVTGPGTQLPRELVLRGAHPSVVVADPSANAICVSAAGLRAVGPAAHPGGGSDSDAQVEVGPVLTPGAALGLQIGSPPAFVAFSPALGATRSDARLLAPGLGLDEVGRRLFRVAVDRTAGSAAGWARPAVRVAAASASHACIGDLAAWPMDQRPAIVTSPGAGSCPAMAPLAAGFALATSGYEGLIPVPSGLSPGRSEWTLSDFVARVASRNSIKAVIGWAIAQVPQLRQTQPDWVAGALAGPDTMSLSPVLRVRPIGQLVHATDPGQPATLMAWVTTAEALVASLAPGPADRTSAAPVQATCFHGKHASPGPAGATAIRSLQAMDLARRFVSPSAGGQGMDMALQAARAGGATESEWMTAMLRGGLRGVLGIDAELTTTGGASRQRPSALPEEMVGPGAESWGRNWFLGAASDLGGDDLDVAVPAGEGKCDGQWLWLGFAGGDSPSPQADPGLAPSMAPGRLVADVLVTIESIAPTVRSFRTNGAPSCSGEAFSRLPWDVQQWLAPTSAYSALSASPAPASAPGRWVAAVAKACWLPLARGVLGDFGGPSVTSFVGQLVESVSSDSERIVAECQFNNPSSGLRGCPLERSADEVIGTVALWAGVEALTAALPSVLECTPGANTEACPPAGQRFPWSPWFRGVTPRWPPTELEELANVSRPVKCSGACPDGWSEADGSCIGIIAGSGSGTQYDRSTGGLTMDVGSVAAANRACAAAGALAGAAASTPVGFTAPMKRTNALLLLLASSDPGYGAAVTSANAAGINPYLPAASKLLWSPASMWYSPPGATEPELSLSCSDHGTCAIHSDQQYGTRLPAALARNLPIMVSQADAAAGFMFAIDGSVQGHIIPEAGGAANPGINHGWASTSDSSKAPTAVLRGTAGAGAHQSGSGSEGWTQGSHSSALCAAPLPVPDLPAVPKCLPPLPPASW